MAIDTPSISLLTSTQDSLPIGIGSPSMTGLSHARTNLTYLGAQVLTNIMDRQRIILDALEHSYWRFY
jgi:hypothetical protein